jgi:HSP20 family protein
LLLTDPFAPFFAQVPRATTFLAPADVTVSEGDLVLTLDLPGLTADDLSIELVDGVLTVRGERKRPELAEGTSWLHAERAFGAFERRIAVPKGVDPQAIMASMDNGVLSLIVPKPERLKPKAIAIASGAEREQLEPATA